MDILLALLVKPVLRLLEITSKIKDRTGQFIPPSKEEWDFFPKLLKELFNKQRKLKLLLINNPLKINLQLLQKEIDKLISAKNMIGDYDKGYNKNTPKKIAKVTEWNSSQDK